MSGHTSSKGHKYKLIVKFTLFTKSFTDKMEHLLTHSFIQKSLKYQPD